jgi:glutamate N-acetyltransferase/amino-acid N-acetyltransferase
MYTANRVKAASVIVSGEYLAGGSCRAVIANSGNANACTGADGLAAARRMAELAAAALSKRGGPVGAGDVAVASTGVIGVPLPLAPIEQGIDALASSLRNDEKGHEAALEAIMTTDTLKKQCAVEFELAGKPVRIGGMVKGSGMIHPNLATMLCFITTDAGISHPLLDSALRRAVKRSFNRVTIDGDTSTNDMVLVMANGLAEHPPIQAEGADYTAFAAALENLCIRLARATAGDGEGASKLVTVKVHGADNDETAELLAKTVASSSLVKAACFGADANWGRVLCAMGYSGAAFDTEAVDVGFASSGGSITVCRNGASVPFSEEDAKRILSQEEIEIRVDLDREKPGGPGPGSAEVWGCDLTYDYVKINGDYRT